MYEPNTDFVIVNNGKNTILLIHCKKCNSFVLFDEPNDIVYLYRLAEEAPLLYAKLTLKKNGSTRLVLSKIFKKAEHCFAYLKLNYFYFL